MLSTCATACRTGSSSTSRSIPLHSTPLFFHLHLSHFTFFFFFLAFFFTIQPLSYNSSTLAQLAHSFYNPKPFSLSEAAPSPTPLHKNCNPPPLFVPLVSTLSSFAYPFHTPALPPSAVSCVG
eukprot:TRINITY_DN15755_c0_g1_i1.p3 TRINITY_DN15755_c0_g1~~TRINITY_DN15755_c0_g1_i1.p3  ORF type:complete len:123 (+),score=6.25 TRINITY_DN15755_c0_g1_i1:101-469(+)